VTVEAVIAAGAVGANIQDSRAPGGLLFDPAEQAARIQAARASAVSAGLSELFINPRTDVFPYDIGVPEDDGSPVTKSNLSVRAPPHASRSMGGCQLGLVQEVGRPFPRHSVPGLMRRGES
jgi:hypothetical protein